MSTQGLIQPDEFRFCKPCNGSGWGEHDICDVCHGWGTIPITAQEITNAIAAGYRESLRFATKISSHYSDQFNYSPPNR